MALLVVGLLAFIVVTIGICFAQITLQFVKEIFKTFLRSLPWFFGLIMFAIIFDPILKGLAGFLFTITSLGVYVGLMIFHLFIKRYVL